MNKLLLIVDPQIDFINGSLPVGGAETAMNQLTEYILETDGKYLFKVATADWHPHNHCSFDINGGQWPVHCVQHSVGATIWPALFDAIHNTSGHCEVLTKGNHSDKEEYSIFRNTPSAKRFNDIILQYNIEQVDICGLAGDICVLNTLKDGIEIYGSELFHTLLSYSPSLDGGALLTEFINSNHL